MLIGRKHEHKPGHKARFYLISRFVPGLQSLTNFCTTRIDKITIRYLEQPTSLTESRLIFVHLSQITHCVCASDKMFRVSILAVSTAHVEWGFPRHVNPLNASSGTSARLTGNLFTIKCGTSCYVSAGGNGELFSTDASSPVISLLLMCIT